MSDTTDRLGIASAAGSMGGESAYAVLARAKELERSGRSIVHLEIGQPDFPTPPHIVKAAVQALEEGKTKYSPSLGIPELRTVVADAVLKTHGVSIPSHRVAICPSAKTGIAMVMASVLNPGDEVVYPDPGFPTYENLTHFFSAVPKPLPILESKHFGFDTKDLECLLSPKTKLIIINSPSNPTGGVLSQKDLAYVAALAKERNIFVLSDEIYSQILYDGARYQSILGIPGMAERTFLVDGFSKTYSMTGWRLGYVIFPDVFREVMDNLAVNIFGCTSAFVQEGGIQALAGDQSCVHAMITEFQKRRDVMVSGLNRIPGISCLLPQGAFYVFPNVERLTKHAKIFSDRLLENVGVAVLPGEAFGKHGDSYVRLSYANSLENIHEALERIETEARKMLRHE